MIRVILFVTVASMLYVSVHCADGEAQMRKSGDMVRAVCQPKFKLTDEQAMGAREGKWLDTKEFKCYTQCVLEMMGMMRKNKVLLEGATKQFDVLLPEEYKEPFKSALNKCHEATGGVKNACDAAMNFLKCFYDNNPKYTFA